MAARWRRYYLVGKRQLFGGSRAHWQSSGASHKQRDAPRGKPTRAPWFLPLCCTLCPGESLTKEPRCEIRGTVIYSLLHSDRVLSKGMLIASVHCLTERRNQ